MDSIWQKENRLPPFPPLTGTRKTDVLIIGGGMAGVLCCYALTQAGVDCLLVEAGRIGQGTTGQTTAKVTAQHGFLYGPLVKRSGLEQAGLYLRANQEAVAEFRRLSRTIPCGFADRDAVVYALDDRAAAEDELKALDKLGAKAQWEADLPLPFPAAGAVKLPGQGQFDPLAFLTGMAKGLPIYEQTKVAALAPGVAVTGRGKVHAKEIIVATHFPLLNKHGGYFMKLYQHRSYVLALKNVPDVGGMYVDGSGKGLSFRSHGDTLLLGGGSHRTGKTGGGWKPLEAFARHHYPAAKVEARWAAQDCMSLDGLPYIGRYGKGTRGLWVATGFNKWGMTSSMVAAKVLADLVQGKENPYAPLFSPARSPFGKQLLCNAAEAALGLLTPTVPRCPHMGCALRYDPQERSWDCSCHGSRFSAQGDLLSGPATGDKPSLGARKPRG